MRPFLLFKPIDGASGIKEDKTVRKLTSCVLMMTLLLSGCAGGGGNESPENLAADIRTEYLALSGWAAEAAVHVDYGERVYDFTLDVQWQKEGDTVLTVTEPELIAGITARLHHGEGYLEYDGASLSTGTLTGDGMTPLDAVPFLMEQLTSGYMARCAYVSEGEEQRLAVTCRDPEAEEGTGSECTLTFDPDTHDLLGAELSYDGSTVLTVQFHQFTKEMTEDDTGDHADLG
jgi:outer membrane lipoprotein-sorting protein